MRPRLVARAAAAASIAVSVVVVATRPAAAQVANAAKDDTGVSASAGSANTTKQAAGARHGGTVATCTAANGTVGRVVYQRVPDDLLIDEQKAQIADGGGIYWKTCGGQSQSKYYPGTGNGGIFIPARTRGGHAVDPGDLAEEAVERTPLPEPTIAMAPGPEVPQLVNLATFLWIPAEQWKPFTASASAGPVTSTVTAKPKRVIWDMGQGDKVVCDGPGLPYDPALSDDANPSTCRFTYRSSSAGQPGQVFTVSATVEWETSWTVSGAAGGGGLGTLRRSSSTSVKVAELQALNVRDKR